MFQNVKVQSGLETNSVRDHRLEGGRSLRRSSDVMLFKDVELHTHGELADVFEEDVTLT